MSSRSEELAAQARDRPAARVALSERDMNAKTHGGTRAPFAEQFVQVGSIRDGCGSATSPPSR
jgi:hypothetical protein